jgi:hypothetical protein
LYTEIFLPFFKFFFKYGFNNVFLFSDYRILINNGIIFCSQAYLKFFFLIDEGNCNLFYLSGSGLEFGNFLFRFEKGIFVGLFRFYNFAKFVLKLKVLILNFISLFDFNVSNP